MIILIAALLLETIVAVVYTLSKILEYVIASPAELNCCGIILYFITVGGKL